MAFLEVIGVASILPFMQLIAEPNAIEQNVWLRWGNELFGFDSERSMLVTMGVAIILLIGLTNLFGIVTVWMQYKYTWDTAHDIGVRLLKTYLQKPYSYFLNKNSAELQTYLISELGNLTGGIFIPIIDLVSRLIVAIVIFGLLMMVDPVISTVMFVSLGGAYGLIYVARQRALRSIGEHRISMNLLRYQSLGELLSGIKTIRVYGVQQHFYDRYDYASKEYCDVQPQFNLILAAPRYMLEFLAFGSILSITIYLYISSGNIQTALPRLSLYAVAGYRLMPALQRVFSAAAKLRHNIPVLENLYKDLSQSLDTKPLTLPSQSPLPFNEKISIQRLDYNYENVPQKVLWNLNIDIPKGSVVAFTGSTGSGKTTLIDLVVGLLYPVGGKIKIDDQTLGGDNIGAWQQQLAYVPQDVFLFDDTIARNIAIGQADEAIDWPLLEEVCKMAEVYEFISKELSDGFETMVGERGVRLSGGQRQRLGLARALYRRPAVLVLDEATSALDSITESGVIEALRHLPEELTILIIAHRLSSVRHADCIYLLENGAVIASGTYDKLIDSNATFQEMVKLS